jgi:hypothetical protein
VIADIDADRDGSLSATIQLQLATTVPALSTGAHQVLSATITTAMAVSIWRTRSCRRAIAPRSLRNAALPIRAS